MMIAILPMLCGCSKDPQKATLLGRWQLYYDELGPTGDTYETYDIHAFYANGEGNNEHYDLEKEPRLDGVHFTWTWYQKGESTSVIICYDDGRLPKYYYRLANNGTVLEMSEFKNFTPTFKRYRLIE